MRGPYRLWQHALSEPCRMVPFLDFLTQLLSECRTDSAYKYHKQGRVIMQQLVDVLAADLATLPSQAMSCCFDCLMLVNMYDQRTTFTSSHQWFITYELVGLDALREALPTLPDPQPLIDRIAQAYCNIAAPSQEIINIRTSFVQHALDAIQNRPSPKLILLNLRLLAALETQAAGVRPQYTCHVYLTATAQNPSHAFTLREGALVRDVLAHIHQELVQEELRVRYCHELIRQYHISINMKNPISMLHHPLSTIATLWQPIVVRLHSHIVMPNSIKSFDLLRWSNRDYVTSDLQAVLHKTPDAFWTLFALTETDSAVAQAAAELMLMALQSTFHHEVNNSVLQPETFVNCLRTASLPRKTVAARVFKQACLEAQIARKGWATRCMAAQAAYKQAVAAAQPELADGTSEAASATEPVCATEPVSPAATPPPGPKPPPGPTASVKPLVLPVKPTYATLAPLCTPVVVVQLWNSLLTAYDAHAEQDRVLVYLCEMLPPMSMLTSLLDNVCTG